MIKYLKLSLLIFLMINASGNVYSQDTKALIENIKEEIESIHLDTALKSVTLQNEEFLQNMTDGGGELTGFYKGKQIYRIYRSIGISYGVGLSEFYYRKNKLIFIREKFNSYVYDSLSQNFDYTKLNTTYSGKFYFSNGNLIDSIVTGNRFFSDNAAGFEKILTGESDEAFNLIYGKIDEK